MTLVTLRGIAVRIRKVMQMHQEFLLLLMLFLSLRLSLLVISQPQGHILSYSDYDFYLELARLSDRGLLPMIDYWTEYPPVFPWMAVLAYSATEAIPNLYGSPIFWFRLALGSLMLPFDVGNLILIYWLGRTLHAPSRALQGAWTYALLFVPIHVWLAWFDTVPLFFLLLGVALAAKGRSSGAAVVAGLGFMVKVFPILVLPLVLKAERRLATRVGLVAEAILAALLVAAPFLVLAPQYLVASFRSMASRSPWETVWALANGYYGYGQVAPLAERTDPSTATFVAHPDTLPWPPITAAFAVLYLYLWTRPFDIRVRLNAVAFAGLSVTLFLLYSKGYSPQFLIYLVPFALLALPLPRAVGYLTVLAAINLLEYPIYGVLVPDAQWLLRDLVLIRTAILLVLVWEFLSSLEIVPSLERARATAAAVVPIGFLLWGALSMPKIGDAWIQTSLRSHPNAGAIEYLLANAGPDSAVVFTEQEVYRDLYPYLVGHTNLFLVDLESQPPSAPPVAPAQRGGQLDEANRVAGLSAGHRETFNVRHVQDENGRWLELLLGRENRLETAHRIRDLAVSRWSNTESTGRGPGTRG